MNKKLYDLMNWPDIEGIVYSDTVHPKKMLGQHLTGKGLLIQCFRPGAVKAYVIEKENGKKHLMQMVDEEAFFAVLINSR